MESKYKTPKTSSLIARDIKLRIIRGELKSGEFLPPETQLMIELGISRPTLREAFRILEEENLVEITRGSRTGAKILAPDINEIGKDVGDYLQYIKTTNKEIYDSRIAFEIFLVEGLAQTTDKSFTLTLKQKADNIKFAVEKNDYLNYPWHMTRFNIALSQCYGNKPLEATSIMVNNLIYNHQRLFQERINQSPEFLRKRFMAGYKSAMKLIRFLEASDSESAIAHWKLHLTNVATSWAIRDEGIRVYENLKYF